MCTLNFLDMFRGPYTDTNIPDYEPPTTLGGMVNSLGHPPTIPSSDGSEPPSSTGFGPPVFGGEDTGSRLLKRKKASKKRLVVPLPGGVTGGSTGLNIPGAGK